MRIFVALFLCAALWPSNGHAQRLSKLDARSTPQNGADAARKNLREYFAKSREVTVRLPSRTPGGIPEDSGTTPPAPSRELSTATVDEVVRSHRREIQNCYEGANTITGKALAPSLTLELEIEPSGHIRSVNPIKGSGRGDLERCMARAIRRWTFPKAERATTLAYAFAFATDR